MHRLILLLFILLPIPALATVFVPVDFNEMVTASQAIVQGRVIDVRSDVTLDRGSIESFVTLDVARSLKGNLGSRVTFKVPGGQVGRYRLIVVGAPHFKADDNVIVFLSARGPSIPYVFGLSQGVYRIARNENGREVVTPPPIVASGAAVERVVRGDPARRLLSVSEFATQVLTILERGR
jgi:hypothetical protein